MLYIEYLTPDNIELSISVDLPDKLIDTFNSESLEMAMKKRLIQSLDEEEVAKDLQKIFLKYIKDNNLIVESFYIETQRKDPETSITLDCKSIEVYEPDILLNKLYSLLECFDIKNYKKVLDKAIKDNGEITFVYEGFDITFYDSGQIDIMNNEEGKLWKCFSMPGADMYDNNFKEVLEEYIKRFEEE